MTTLSFRLLLASLLLVAGGSVAKAWDTTPGEDGLYDGLYDRPTYVPDWKQPSTWPNAMYYLCDVRSGAANGPQVTSYEVAVYDQNDKLRFCGRSIPKDNNLSMLTIRGEEGDVFHFKVVYGDDFQNPTIVDVPELTVAFKTNDEKGTPTDPFLLIIPGRIYLSEYDTEAPAAATGVDVTVFRTIEAGIWDTICLPFTIPGDEMENAFGTEVDLGDFTGCEVTYTDETEETVQSINVKFERATAIDANHPYIIKVKDDVSEINIDDVDIEQGDAVVKKDKLKTFYNKFIGNYVNNFQIPEQNLFLSGGKFCYSTGKTPMMAFRGYFDFYDVLPEMEDAGDRITLTFDGTVTEVVCAAVALPTQQTVQTYDLQGRRMESSQSSILKKGLYIKNGRKFIIK